MNRRNFIKISGGVTAGSLLQSVIAKTRVNPNVYELSDSNLMNSSTPDPEKVNETQVQNAVDAIVMFMTKKTNRGEAWQTLFPGITKSSKIAIKVNALKDNNAPQLATLRAIINGFNDMFDGTFSVTESNVFLIDNNLSIGGSSSTNHVDGAFGSGNLDSLKVWHGLDSYNGPSVSVAGTILYVSSKFAEADYGINFLVPRRHQYYAGNLSGFIKNMMGAVSKDRNTYDALSSGTGSFHDNNNYQAFIDIFNNYFNTHTHLYIGDMILIPRNEGANYFDKIENLLIMGTDPCAMDSYAVDILTKYYSVTRNVPAALEDNGIGSTSYVKIPVKNVKIINKSQNPGKPIIIKINHPNVSSSGAKIDFNGSLRNAKITIHNPEGKTIRSFHTHEKTIYWDGTNSQGSLVPSGTYIVTITENGNFTSAKIVLKK